MTRSSTKNPRIFFPPARHPSRYVQLRGFAGAEAGEPGKQPKKKKKKKSSDAAGLGLMGFTILLMGVYVAGQPKS